MDAIKLQDSHVSFCKNQPIPTPADDEVLVEVLQAGICETDLQLARGYMGFQGVLGHEFVGVAQSGRFSGRRVVGEINCNCRQCPRCASGLGNHCPNRTVIGIDKHDGAFAQFVSVPEHCLHPVPESISNDQAVLVEPLAAGFQILSQVSFTSETSVLILGDGRLAYMSAQALLTVVAPENLSIVGKHSAKLARFDRWSITTHPLNQLESVETKSFDVVIDCTGSKTGLPLALQMVRPRGTVVLKTTVAGHHDLSLAAIVIDEINIVGSRCGPFAKAIEA